MFGHNRYSTNTWPSFKRVQPFGILGGHGEISVLRLRQEATMLGVPITDDGSDSQDLNRTVESLISREGLSLVEAMELVLPPIVNEIKRLPASCASTCTCGRHSGRSPRDRSRCCRATATSASSPPTPRPAAALAPRGCRLPRLFVRVRVAPVSDTVGEPKPLAGEKLLVESTARRGSAAAQPSRAPAALRPPLAHAHQVESDGTFAGAILTGGPTTGAEIPGYTSARPSEPIKVEDRVLGGFGWQREDMKLVQQMANTGAEPIGSLGYDGPLACSRPRGRTAPTTSRSRWPWSPTPRSTASARWSTSPAGPCSARPGIHGIEEAGTIETAFPVLLGGHDGRAPLSDQSYREVAREHKTFLLEDLWEAFRGRAKVIDLSSSPRPPRAPSSGSSRATTAVRDGCELLVISDRTVYEGDRRYLDPHLALAAVDLALREHFVQAGRGQPAPPLRHRPALGGHPQRP